jgi:hypothetical protein
MSQLSFTKAAVPVLLALTGAVLAQPTPTKKPILSFAGPITLRVSMTQRGKLDNASLEAYIDRRSKSLTEIYRKRGVEEKNIERQIASFVKRTRDQQTNKRFVIEYSVDGNRSLYVQKELEEDRSVFSGPEKKLTVLFDGEHTFEILSGNPHVTVSSGRNDQLVQYLPLPGVGISSVDLIRLSHDRVTPDVPLTSGVEVATVRRADSHSAYSYVPGTATFKGLDGQVILSRATTSGSDKPREEWVFSNYEAKGTSMLAKQFTWTDYVEVKESGSPVPLIERVYEIQEAVTASPDPTVFKAASYIAKGTTLLERGSDGKPLQYPFDPALSISEMRKNLENFELRDRPAKRQESSVVPLLVSVLITSSVAIAVTAGFQKWRQSNPSGLP